ncbi:MAG TPA: ABC transporter substrate-binding protein [Anaerolineales bacterium]|nr:ABC transporter substrate-binding protein [Anaerolineales bacterium]
MKKFYMLCAVVAILAASLAGCAPAPTATTVAPVATAALATAVPVAPTAVPTEDPETAKIAGAKKEGQIISYGMSDDWVNFGNMWQSLELQYDIVHTDTDMTSAQEITHLLAEKNAPVMDVADIGFDFVGTLIDDNLAMPYKNTSWDKIAAQYKDADGRWVVAYWGAISFLVNTDLVKDSPQTWDDLLKPEYHDMVCSRDPSQSTYATGAVLAAAYAHGGGEADVQPGLDFFKKLHDTGNWRNGVVLNVASVQKGECPISIVYDFDGFAKRDATGLPLKVVIPQDATVGMYFVEYISAVAPHPNAAKLEQDFWLSDQGQMMLAQGYAHPARSDVQLPPDVAAKLLPMSAYGNIHFPTSFDSFTQAMHAIVSGWTTISAQ